jgi:hypothetical protein
VGSVEESGLKVRLSRRNACGQLLALFPTQELVIVMTSGAYGDALGAMRLVQAASDSD